MVLLEGQIVSISGLVGHPAVSVPITRASPHGCEGSHKPKWTGVDAPQQTIQMIRHAGLAHGVSLPSPNLKHVLLVLSEMGVMVQIFNIFPRRMIWFWGYFKI